MFLLSRLTIKVTEECKKNVYLYLCKGNFRWNLICLEKSMNITVHSNARNLVLDDRKKPDFFLLTRIQLSKLETEM
jgi:hypothetical protein